ncbi:MAG: hypothetical protein ACYC1L_08780 [Alphaproteobacteria bacterium]
MVFAMTAISPTAERRPTNIAILGDSRAFDTYYTNDRYEERYGYDSTFPFLLRQLVTADSSLPFEIIHIPDHFRAGSIASNIIRLALLDPAAVILLDGIWETLVGKEHLVEYATCRIRAHDLRSAEEIILRIGGQATVELFLSGELSISPASYVEKQRQLVSYFRRRRRQCAWLTLPIPDSSHFERLHFAGNYRCLPDWERCLAGINKAVTPMVEAYGGRIIDLDRLMTEHGGTARSLIDQWHFTRSFHSAVANHLAEWLHTANPMLPAAHVSNRYMMAGPIQNEPVLLCGAKNLASVWSSANPGVSVEAVFEAHDLAGEDAASQATSSIVILLEENAHARIEAETRLLKILNEKKIILYPEELGGIINPLGNRRAEQGLRPSSDPE